MSALTQQGCTQSHTHTRHHHRIDSLSAFGKESKKKKGRFLKGIQPLRVTPDDVTGNWWEILLFNFRRPQMTFDSCHKQLCSSSQHEKYVYQVWKVSIIPFLRYRDYEVFGLWRLVPSDDLDLHQNIKIFTLDLTNLYTKYEKCRSSLSQGILFTRFSVFDLWWPQMTFDLYQKQ